jgi:hypothetical protein
MSVASLISAAAAIGVTSWSASRAVPVPLTYRPPAPPVHAAATPAPVLIPTPNLSDRERAVLSRLAQLPDLPMHGEPVFRLTHPGSAANEHAPAMIGVGVRSADTAPARKETHPREGAASELSVTSGARKGPLDWEATLVDIEVVAVERGRLYYRAVDGMTHVAAPGQRLLGVDGHVVRIRGDQVDLQINGRALTVSATNT